MLKLIQLKDIVWVEVHLQDEFGLLAFSLQLLILVQTACLPVEETEIQRS